MNKEIVRAFKITILIPSIVSIFMGILSLFNSIPFIYISNILLICIGWILGYLLLFIILHQSLQGDQ